MTLYRIQKTDRLTGETLETLTLRRRDVAARRLEHTVREAVRAFAGLDTKWGNTAISESRVAANGYVVCCGTVVQGYGFTLDKEE